MLQSVSQKRIIVVPEVMEDPVDGDTQGSQLLIALSLREMQALIWTVSGYASNIFAYVLSRGTKAAERQVSNLYPATLV